MPRESTVRPEVPVEQAQDVTTPVGGVLVRAAHAVRCLAAQETNLRDWRRAIKRLEEIVGRAEAHYDRVAVELLKRGDVQPQDVPDWQWQRPDLGPSWEESELLAELRREIDWGTLQQKGATDEDIWRRLGTGWQEHVRETGACGVEARVEKRYDSKTFGYKTSGGTFRIGLHAAGVPLTLFELSGTDLLTRIRKLLNIAKPTTKKPEPTKGEKQGGGKKSKRAKHVQIPPLAGKSSAKAKAPAPAAAATGQQPYARWKGAVVNALRPDKLNHLPAQPDVDARLRKLHAAGKPARDAAAAIRKGQAKAAPAEPSTDAGEPAAAGPLAVNPPTVPPRARRYTLQELGLKRREVDGAVNPGGPHPTGRGKVKQPGKFGQLVKVRGRPYWCNSQAFTSDGNGEACSYVSLRPLYTPAEWGNRPSAIDPYKLPGEMEGEYMTGAIGLDAKGTRWVIGPSNETIRVQVYGRALEDDEAEEQEAAGAGNVVEQIREMREADIPDSDPEARHRTRDLLHEELRPLMDDPSVNDHGVYARAEAVDIALPKSVGIKVTLYAAKGNDGLWRGAHRIDGKAFGQGSLPSVNGETFTSRDNALWQEAGSVLDWCRGTDARGADAVFSAVDAFRDTLDFNPRSSGDPEDVPTCRVCGCTDLNCEQCVDRTGGPCSWAAEDLCSACDALPEKVLAYVEPLNDDCRGHALDVWAWFAGADDLPLRQRGVDPDALHPEIPLRPKQLTVDQLRALAAELSIPWRGAESPAEGGRLRAGDRVKLVGKKKYGLLIEVRTDGLVVEWEGKRQVREVVSLETHVQRVAPSQGSQRPSLVAAARRAHDEVIAGGGTFEGALDAGVQVLAEGAAEPDAAPARAKFHKLDEDVEEVLRLRLSIEGNNVKINGQLERNLCERVNKALIKLGGKWKGGKTKAHVFSSDPVPAIAAALNDGQVLDRKKTFQFFETPAELAARMVKLAELRPAQRILEPSAGRGAIAREIFDRMPDECLLCLVEMDKEHNPALHKFQDDRDPDLIHVWTGKDFLQWNEGLITSPRTEEIKAFDRILMNPPFANGQDVEHVRHAYDLLKPGGVLVAITGPSAWSNQDKRSRAWREWLDEVPVDLEEDLPAGTFAASGTDVAAKLLVLHKPEASAAPEPAAAAAAELPLNAERTSATAEIDQLTRQSDTLADPPPAQELEERIEQPKTLEESGLTRYVLADFRAAYSGESVRNGRVKLVLQDAEGCDWVVMGMAERSGRPTVFSLHPVCHADEYVGTPTTFAARRKETRGGQRLDLVGVAVSDARGGDNWVFVDADQAFNVTVPAASTSAAPASAA